MNKEFINYLIPVIPFSSKVMVRAQDSYLFDTEGNKYLDLNSGQFCSVLGFSNPSIAKCVSEGAEKIVHTSTAILTEDVLKCAVSLHRISGKMQAYSILLSTGSEAVEFCLRYAKYIKNADGIICFDKGYHGLTLGSQSVTYSGVYTRPSVPNVYSIPIPPSNIGPDMLKENLQLLEKTITDNRPIAAILVEPIVSVGGMLFPPKEWFQGVRELCTKHNILLIFDECQTGFGRTGDWFAFQTYDVIPDMIATAKGLGQGYPVSAALFRQELIPDSGFLLSHYSSHQNDSFAASIVNCGIALIEQGEILEQVQRTGIYFLKRLKELEKANSHLHNARGCGLMLGIDFSFNGVTNYRGLYKEFSDALIAKGIIVQGTNGGRTLRFLPNYLIKKSDIDMAVEAIHKTLCEKNWSEYE